MIGGVDHVLHAGRFANQHAGVVIFLQYGIQTVQLVADGVAGYLVFRVDEHQLPLAIVQQGADGIRQDVLRHHWADNTLEAENVFHAVYLLHLIDHIPHITGGEIGVHQQHVGGGDVEVLRQLGIGDHIVDVLRQALAHVVIDLVVGLVIAVVGRSDQQGEDDEEYGEVQQQNHAGQNSDAADDTQQHALGHHNAQVAAQGEAHEAQGDEASDSGDGAADDRGEGLVDGHGHGLVMVGGALELLVVAVPQEDGVVHGDGQLQHGGQGLGDVGYLAEEVVAAQIEHNAHADAGQKYEGHQPAVQQQHHGGAGTGHRQRHINGLLLLAQVLQVGDQRRHAGDEALLSGDGADVTDGVHGHILAGGRVEEHRHHGGVPAVKGVIELVGQHLHGYRQVGQRVVPQHGIHMVHGLDLLLQGGYVPDGHVLHDDEGEGALAEVVLQGILSDDGVHIVGQVVEHIVIDAGVQHAEHRGDHQCQRQNQNQHAVFDDRFCSTHGSYSSFPIS